MARMTDSPPSRRQPPSTPRHPSARTAQRPTPDKDQIALLEPFERLGLDRIALVATPAQADQACDALAGASAIFLLQLASFYVGQLVLPEANYLQTVEETRLPLRVNVLSLILFVLACGGVMAIVPPGADAVIGLFSVLLGATLTRNLLLRRAVLRRAPEVFA